MSPCIFGHAGGFPWQSALSHVPPEPGHRRSPKLAKGMHFSSGRVGEVGLTDLCTISLSIVMKARCDRSGRASSESGGVRTRRRRRRCRARAQHSLDLVRAIRLLPGAPSGRRSSRRRRSRPSSRSQRRPMISRAPGRCAAAAGAVAHPPGRDDVGDRLARARRIRLRCRRRRCPAVRMPAALRLVEEGTPASHAGRHS